MGPERAGRDVSQWSEVTNQMFAWCVIVHTVRTCVLECVPRGVFSRSAAAGESSGSVRRLVTCRLMSSRWAAQGGVMFRRASPLHDCSVIHSIPSRSRSFTLVFRSGAQFLRTRLFFFLTRQPLCLRATRQPLGGGGIKLSAPLLLQRYRRNAKR